MSDNHEPLSHNNGHSALGDFYDSSSDEDVMLTDDDGSGSSIEEVADEDIANYFLEVDRRLYHSHPSAPYPLPVDTPENDRSKAYHAILKRLIGANYHGPVDAVLAVNEGRSPQVLDVGCGVGIWIKDMAADFPHAQFTGIDIVPLATRYPPPNVQFELDDVNAQLRWGDGHFDLVHARDVILAVTDYSSFLDEAARVLRPGGLLLSVEWANHITLHPSHPGVVEDLAHVSTHFYDTIDHILRGLGINPDGSVPSTLITNSAHFRNVSIERIDVPIGAWDTDEERRLIGSSFRAAQKKLAIAYRQ
ncbi:hypothetical protein NMY22_g10236 [Coprinellus aureogranulatus]|nr:hypothetical protein NMY22_g10236 [Coprinellus aureogranulatus]